MERVYLTHTCDDDLGELVQEQTFGFIGRNAFWRRKLSGRWSLEASGANVIWFDDPDVLDQTGDADKDPYEEDRVTVQKTILDGICRRARRGW